MGFLVALAATPGLAVLLAPAPDCSAASAVPAAASKAVEKTSSDKNEGCRKRRMWFPGCLGSADCQGLPVGRNHSAKLTKPLA